jgi:serine phosphatase RsbU (regulator of sigma subunit)
VVTAPTGPLGGTLPQRLPWIFGVVGAVLSIGLAWITGRLVRRRRVAERDATEIRLLYGQQRTIAETLQHALLPRETPEIPGLEVAVRYLPGAVGVDIGGDWYSIDIVDAEHFAFVIGDVSGRGVSAASVMAGLRFTLRAYALEGFSPTVILEKCSTQLSILTEGHFATVLVGVGSVSRHEVTFANAGHLNPLVIDGEKTEFVTTSVGPPLGLPGGVYDSTTTTIPAGSTMIAFTDGLVERRGECLDVGMKRLEDATSGQDCPLDDLLTKVIGDLHDASSNDDIAILGLRWRN